MKSFRSLLVILAVLFPLSLFAQQNEVGVFLSKPEFKTDDVFSGLLSIDLDGDVGYGATYNRYWTDHLSTEFGIQRLSADTTLDIGGVESFDAGTVDLTALSGVGQWHFATKSRVSPYLGGGVIYVTGEADGPDDPTDPASPSSTDDLKSDTALLLNGGVDFRVSPAVAISLDAKYFSYDAQADEPDAIPLGIDTWVFAAGVKFRF